MILNVPGHIYDVYEIYMSKKIEYMCILVYSHMRWLCFTNHGHGNTWRCSDVKYGIYICIRDYILDWPTYENIHGYCHYIYFHNK